MVRYYWSGVMLCAVNDQIYRVYLRYCVNEGIRTFKVDGFYLTYEQYFKRKFGMKKTSFFLIVYLCCSFQSLFSQDSLKLTKYAGNLKQIKVMIGGEQYNFLFDTGGGETFISPDIAKKLGRVVYGQRTGFRMHGEPISWQLCDSVDMRIGNTAFFIPELAVWDLMSILPADFPRLDGIISLKTLDSKKFTLNLAEGQIILETAKSFKRKIKNSMPLKVRFASGISGSELNLFIGLLRNHRHYWFLFDSGNLDKVLFSPITAFEWGLKKDTSSARIELGPVSLPMVKNEMAGASAAAILHDGALNFEALKNYIFMIDLRNKKVWAKER